MMGSVKLADGVKLKAEDNDVGSLISAQFDSLSSKFQIILKVASVAGLNFSLSHVVQVCNDVLTARSMGSSISLEEAASIIETEDVHDFLQHPNGKSENGEDVCIAETYFFRHIYIHKGIKSMILMDLRKSIHFQLFLYLDMSVRKENSILQAFDISIPHNPNGTDDPFGYPLLEAFRHLEESGGMLETILHTVNEIRFPDIVAAAIRLDYLAGTAVYYCEKQIYGESLVVLDRLFSYWDEIPQLGNRLLMKDEDWKRPELFILTDQLMKANLMTMKSYLYRVCAEVQKSYDAQMMGFEYIGHPFPHSNSDCVKYLLKRINPVSAHLIILRIGT
ncbi:hypothetical protein BC829DRAFT_28254 [Chytridium lagenaria]|nr:hypothetical protein BC829DRAFT_28254 [Chytridium lagenaria]